MSSLKEAEVVKTVAPPIQSQKYLPKYDSDDDSNNRTSNAANKSISRYSAGSSTINADVLNQKSKKLLNSTNQNEDIFSNDES